MLFANRSVMRFATVEDDHTLHSLAELDSQPPISRPALVGALGGNVVAAMSLVDDRIVADPFLPTAVVRPVLRTRATALAAHSRTPSLATRIRAAVAPFHALDVRA
jgi:hypothetical protein